jgi:CRISPR-associated protein Cmr4
MIYLHALTPVHSGTGQAAAIVDLPIAREKATGWPVIPSSSLKGVLKDALSDGENEQWLQKAFGKKEDAGALCFGDQRILCLPVRSFFGTFAYVTCPLALVRFQRDCAAAGLISPFQWTADRLEELEIHLPEGSVLAREEKVYLEDLDLIARSSEEAAAVARSIAGAVFPESERSVFERRFAVVSDEVFNFLSETATEVTARVRLEECSKTVASGGLWYEEAVPAEAIFAGPVVVAGHRRNDVSQFLDGLKDTSVQIGGKASVGKGFCRVRVRV